MLEIHELSREPGDRKQRERASTGEERDIEGIKGRRGDKRARVGLLEFRKHREETLCTR